MTWLLLTLPLIPLLIHGVKDMRIKQQSEYDLERVTYSLSFPADVAGDRVAAILRILNSSISHDWRRIFGLQTIVFEVLADGNGLKHRIIIPRQLSDRIATQLRHQMPGLVVEQDKSRQRPDWAHVAEVGMTNSARTLSVASPSDLSTAILTAASQAMSGKEALQIQWIISPIVHEHLPTHDNPPLPNNVWQLLKGESLSREEVDDRRKKLSEPNFLAIGRIGAVATSDGRAKYLVTGVLNVLRGANGHGAQFRVIKNIADAKELSDRLNRAATPLLFPAQLNVSELTALLGLPIGSPFIPGLPRATGRHLYTTEEVARAGRVIGESNYPGHKRPVALAYDKANLHAAIFGASGSGKSALMANWIAQDMAAGYGVIVIDASNSESDETLFNRALRYVPHHRLSDVVVMDVHKSDQRPVGFNVLDQGNGYMVVDQIAGVIQQLYPESKSIWSTELLFHGLHALIDHGDATLMDLMPLIRPSNDAERAWSKEVIRSVKDARIQAFWRDWQAFKDEDKRTKSQPLYDRLWQFTSRPEVFNILGQTKSAFKMRHVLQRNEIILINLAGLPSDTAALLGTLLFNTLWSAAQALSPAKANFVYLDEFQQMLRSQVQLDDVLARARKHQLGLNLATQYLDGSKIDNETKAAIINNTGTKAIFNVSKREAKTWADEFGQLTPEDFVNLKKFNLYAKIANDIGSGSPVSIAAAPPLPEVGLHETAVNLSDTKFGRSITDVEADILTRRSAKPGPQSEPPNYGRRQI